MGQFRRFYGANPLHLLAVLCCFALVGYAVMVTGPDAFWNPAVWWQSIVVWFAGALIAHDLIIYPLYAAADRSLSSGLDAMRGRRAATPPAVPAINYIRIPVMASALTFLMFMPGILRQGAGSYFNATGMTQDPFLARWLLLCAGLFAASAIAYAARLAVHARRAPSEAAP